ncbi:MAG: hypothetical protein VXZ72_01190 [Chlamydiota bacterium]|nr:hypothetical protein [Chlamydiota bacterium]
MRASINRLPLVKRCFSLDSISASSDPQRRFIRDPSWFLSPTIARLSLKPQEDVDSMSLTIAPGHRSFYQKKGWILLYDIFLEEEWQAIYDHIPSSGYDQWRGSPAMKRIATKKNRASIASQLVGIPILRLAFDYTFHMDSHHFSLPKEMKPSSLTELPIALLFPLTPNGDYPPKSALFVSLHDDLADSPPPHYPGPWMGIAYATAQSRYRNTPTEPFSRWMKQQGYSAGDALISPTNPLFDFQREGINRF